MTINILNQMLVNILFIRYTGEERSKQIEIEKDKTTKVIFSKDGSWSVE